MQKQIIAFNRITVQYSCSICKCW